MLVLVAHQLWLLIIVSQNPLVPSQVEVASDMIPPVCHQNEDDINYMFRRDRTRLSFPRSARLQESPLIYNITTAVLLESLANPITPTVQVHDVSCLLQSRQRRQIRVHLNAANSY